MAHDMNIEAAVSRRYGAAAEKTETALCCPIDYDAEYLEVLPDEILERDYGCGDPSSFVREGDSVLDLGSGGGKICYIASQMTGPHGLVVGVDANIEMLNLARKHKDAIEEKIGFSNVEFKRGKIQDLKTDLDAVDRYLNENPVRSAADLDRYNSFMDGQRSKRPLIADGSMDLILSNCVLNLVGTDDKAQMFEEMFRVLNRGGRVAVSDIVADEDVPAHLQNDPELWSGCISGAYREDRLIDAFDTAGFYGMEVVRRDESPWQIVDGIEFRSITLVAYKGKQGPCLERNQAVIYKGPWKRVLDDDGHALERGHRMAVCDKTYRLYTSEPYTRDIIAVDPLEEVPLEGAVAFDCERTSKRDPRETKGMDYRETKVSSEVCGPDGDCC